MNRVRWPLVTFLIVVALAGGLLLAIKRQGQRSFVDSGQVSREDGFEVALEPGQSVGQTFVARHAGLSGVEFYLLLESSVPIRLTMHLRTDPQSATDLATASLELPSEARPGFYRFVLPPLDSSHSQYYYAFLEAPESGVSVTLAHGEMYWDGSAYRNHQPLDAQTTFRLVYAPGLVVADLLKAALGWIGLLAVTGLVFVVPGWAVLVWLLPQRRLAWPEMLGLAAGVGLALYPLLFSWTDLVGLHLGRWYVWLPTGAGLIGLILRYRTWRPRKGWSVLRQWARSQALWPELTLVIVLALVFGVRLLVVRTLDAPLWADSYQHTTITQLMLDNGGLFDSWEPYTPYQSMTVHFGFSTAAALLAWATGMSSTLATLLAGQLINGLAILTLYPLAVRIANGNRWAGVGAVLVAGLLSPMPAHYVNWGRFAQLAGQAILPVALWLMWETVQSKGRIWKTASLAAFVGAGMTLAYYRMPFYYAMFVLAWLIGWGLPHWRLNGRLWLRGLARLAVIAGIWLLLLLPQGSRMTGALLVEGLGVGISTASPLESVLADYRQWRNIRFYVPLPLLIVTVVALICSLLRRCWTVAALGLWVLGVAAMVAGQLIRLPGAIFMQSFAILIGLYIPVGLLGGWLIGQVADLLGRWRKQWVLAVVIVVVAGWTALDQIKIMEPSRVLVTRPDTLAMAWIQHNTPPESLFLVEGYRMFEGHSAVGGDGGWWIPLLAGRQNTMPPQYALLSEAPAEPGYSQRVVDLVARLEENSPASAEGIQLLCDWSITNVYVGQGQGEIGPEAVQLFSPTALAGSSAFSQVYHQDRVWIFALDPQMCGARN
jgi:hypothetical protein